MSGPPPPLLPPEIVARLRRLRLSVRRRVEGRYAGAHTSRRHGSSLDFAEHRAYVAGDDPRRVDLAAYRRLGRLLVKLFEAEDEAAIRVVVDLSASMGFGGKADAARRLAAAFCALAAGGQDRARVLLVTAAGVDAGPWLRGPSALPAVEARLVAASADPPAEATGPGNAPDLVAALRRAHGEGPVGPVLLISDLLFDGWEEVIRALAAGRGDGLVAHLLGREDLEPAIRGDLRLVDSEAGVEVEVGVDDEALGAYAASRDAWLDGVAAACGRAGVAYARVVDDEPLEHVVTVTLRRLGLVA